MTQAECLESEIAKVCFGKSSNPRVKQMLETNMIKYHILFYFILSYSFKAFLLTVNSSTFL